MIYRINSAPTPRPELDPALHHIWCAFQTAIEDAAPTRKFPIMIKLTRNQTSEYETNDEFRKAMQRAVKADARAIGEQIELHDVEGNVLLVSEPVRGAR